MGAPADRRSRRDPARDRRLRDDALRCDQRAERVGALLPALGQGHLCQRSPDALAARLPQRARAPAGNRLRDRAREPGGPLRRRRGRPRGAPTRLPREPHAAPAGGRPRPGSLRAEGHHGGRRATRRALRLRARATAEGCGPSGQRHLRHQAQHAAAERRAVPLGGARRRARLPGHRLRQLPGRRLRPPARRRAARSRRRRAAESLRRHPLRRRGRSRRRPRARAERLLRRRLRLLRIRRTARRRTSRAATSSTRRRPSSRP